MPLLLSSFIREMATSEASDAADGGLNAWDDGGKYARAAEAAGVDVGGMLEAGVDAKQLLDFVSNYRRTEGEPISAWSLTSTCHFGITPWVRECVCRYIIDRAAPRKFFDRSIMCRGVRRFSNAILSRRYFG